MSVPFVIVTGFLGSGKTTLVNRLLARRAARPAPEMERGSERWRAGKATLAIIVNELGEVGIDGALIADGSSRQVELPGGCVCCVLGDDLDRTLIELCARSPEAIVLETSGVAEPLPISWAVARAPVNAYVRLAAVVTVVDAANFGRSRALSDAVDAQVAYADVVLVTKTELATVQELSDALADVHTLAPHALVRLGSTDDHAAWLETTLADPDLPDRVAATPVAAGHIHDESCRHPDSESVEHAADHGHRHAHGIDSVWVPIDGVVDLEELEDQLSALPANYVRIKGITRATDGRVGQRMPRWVVFHRVGLRVSSEAIADARDVGPGRAVALGPSVDAAKLAECVAAAIIDDTTSA